MPCAQYVVCPSTVSSGDPGRWLLGRIYGRIEGRQDGAAVEGPGRYSTESEVHKQTKLQTTILGVRKQQVSA